VKFRAVKRPDGWVKSRVIAYKNGSLLKLETNEKRCYQVCGRIR